MTTDLSVAAAKAKKNPTIEDYLRQYEPEFQRALGQSLDAAKFAQDALTAIKQNPQIGQSDPRSLFGALFLAAQLRLPVGGPLAQFHLTTRKVKGQLTVVPIVGYQGYVQLVMNTGLYSKVNAFLVHENDYFKAAANSERGEFYDFDRAQGERGAVVGVIAYAKIRGYDETSWVYVEADVMRAKHRPQYWESTPWKTDEGEMFKKTGIRVLQKYLPKSTDAAGIALAAQADQAVVRKFEGVPDLDIQSERTLDDDVVVVTEQPTDPVDEWETKEIPK
jgi:recombination protein RecT